MLLDQRSHQKQNCNFVVGQWIDDSATMAAKHAGHLTRVAVAFAQNGDEPRRVALDAGLQLVQRLFGKGRTLAVDGGGRVQSLGDE